MLLLVDVSSNRLVVAIARAFARASFPSCTWERLLFSRSFTSRRLIPLSARPGSAVKLPQQVRSQVQLGNEEREKV